MLGATLGYAAGPMLAAKTLADLPPIAPVTGALAVSTVALLPLAIIDPPGGGVPFKAWGSVIVLGIACTAVALVVFFVLLTEAGPVAGQRHHLHQPGRRGRARRRVPERVAGHGVASSGWR